MPQHDTGTSLLALFGTQHQGEIMLPSSLWLLLRAPNLPWTGLGQKDKPS